MNNDEASGMKKSRINQIWEHVSIEEFDSKLMVKLIFNSFYCRRMASDSAMNKDGTCFSEPLRSGALFPDGL
jgi:hypothetical protein